VIPGNQNNEEKLIGLSLFFFFFFEASPQTGLHRKRKRREKSAFVWEKKTHGSLFPKVVFVSKASKGAGGGWGLLTLQKTLPGFSFCFSCFVWTSSSFVVFFLLQLRRFVSGHFSTSASVP
jgi:hypothetical protein